MKSTVQPASPDVAVPDRLPPWLDGVRLLWQRCRGRGGDSRPGLEDSLAACRLLFELAIDVQQHRGLTGAWLAGDADFLALRQARQAAVEARFPELLRLARDEGRRPAPCFGRLEVMLFIFNWRSLVDSLAEQSPERNIAAHSQLIGLLLKWRSALGEARIEPGLGRDGHLGRVRNFTHRLPALAECLGLARAVGVGVAARQACSPTTRVRLMFLIGRAESLLEQAARADDGRPARVARAALRSLANAVRTRMLLSDGVSLSPLDYFAVATGAIDGVADWVGENSRQLQARAGDGGMREALAA